MSRSLFWLSSGQHKGNSANCLRGPGRRCAIATAAVRGGGRPRRQALDRVEALGSTFSLPHAPSGYRISTAATPRLQAEARPFGQPDSQRIAADPSDAIHAALNPVNKKTEKLIR
jgi:hypothetical protein